MKLLRVPIFILSFLTATAEAQQTNTAAGSGSRPFSESGSRKFWMGANYRREWNTPIQVPVIDLSKEHGGLTALKKGGGKQTKSLKLEDADGKQYSLRSIQKFITSKTLPGDLQSEAAADLVADGVSASYPYAALSVPILSEAAGIPHGDAKLVFIPDDPRLGEFRKDFSNMLALYESRLPDSVKKTWDTEEVVDKLKDDNDNTVDQAALLRIRILDMFMMDLDRHEDQWEWGAWDNGKGKTYYPIAKDRDQAFYINEGFLPGLIKKPWLVPQIEGFKPKAKNINRFNYAARNLDRFFLNGLSRETWQSEVNSFLSKMTDDVIDRALDQQPGEIRGISAEKIKKTLKERRKYLADEVMQYYRFLAEIVSVTASDKRELFNIDRTGEGNVQLSVYKINKEGERSTKMFDRLFTGKETEELRLYGFGGDDQFVVNGTNDKIRIRMIGGDGKDQFINEHGSSGGNMIYDRKDGDNTVKGPFRNKFANDTVVNSYQRIYYKYNNVIPFISVGYNSDDGISLGAWLKIIRHGFRKEPAKNVHTITINHALSTNSYLFRYNGEFIGALGRNNDLVLEAEIKAPNNTTNFFGYGMNTIYDKSKPGKFKYYRARYSLGDFSALMRTNISKKVTMMLGPTFQFYHMESDDKFNGSRFITMTGLNGLNPVTLFAKQSYIGGKFALNIDTRDNPVLPQKGVNWNNTARFLSGLTDESYKVTQVNSDLTLLMPLVPNRLVLADRVGGGHNFGTYEFYQAQYLGSEDNLRGYRKYRFAGRSKLYNNLEMRLRVANFKTYLFPGSLGVLGFYDIGRVWTDANTGDKWASGYGGGLWVSPLRRMVLTFTYATSKEDRMVLIGLGWKF